jgi:hypothetical protein
MPLASYLAMPVTMSTFNWEHFMRQWSREWLESSGNGQNVLPTAVIQSGWLGYPGATEAQIVQAETRLGIRLPPSYRDFLKVTNGWRQTTPFIYQLWSTAEIEWFAVRHRAWIDCFVERFVAQGAREPSTNGFGHAVTNGAGRYRDRPSDTASISDAEYFIYGEAQDCMALRVGYLQTALEISPKGDSAIYLLNPQVITPEGEWEAWFFGDWLPGADRYQSFLEMMQAEYENFLELRERG